MDRMPQSASSTLTFAFLVSAIAAVGSLYLLQPAIKSASNSLDAIRSIGTLILSEFSSMSMATNVAKLPRYAFSPMENTRVAHTTLGVNLSVPYYYATHRAFSNLAAGSNWGLQVGYGWGKMALGQVNSEGVVTYLNSNEMATRNLITPPAVLRGENVRIRCTYVGSGSINVYGNSTLKRSGNSITFIWPGEKNRNPLVPPNWLMVKVTKTDPANPVRKLDCREADALPSDLYDPAFIRSLAPFKVIRFMDWMNTNANNRVTWASRTTAASNIFFGDDGASIENMVALANQAGKDAWFSLPWNANDDYYRRFAAFVRDNLQSDRKAYVEISNEVWNWSFPATTQAANEGMAEGLSTNKGYAMNYRYAEKTADVMKIWTEVFKGQTERIVRVASTQAAWSNSADLVLGYSDTAKYIDALAIAPYVGGDLTNLKADKSDLNDWFDTTVPTIFSETLKWIESNRSIARKYHKRLICYEGGQHFTSSTDLSLLSKVNRHPRMGDLYRQYLTSWQKNYGDTIMLYHNVGIISKFGAWGMLEYQGQPITESPKMNAVVVFSKSL